jgi:hypothetical protein
LKRSLSPCHRPRKRAIQYTQVLQEFSDALP